MKAEESGIDIPDRAGGVKVNLETGVMEQMSDQSSTSTGVAVFSNNRRDKIPIILIVGQYLLLSPEREDTDRFIGAKNPHCPTVVPHRYNVLGAAHVTDTWTEKAKGKVVVCRVRFEMIDLTQPSWWGIKGSPLPTQTPDYASKALVKTCTACGAASKQILEAGWECLNESCEEFSKVDGQVHRGAPIWNPAFINERNKWPAHIKAPLKLKPAPPTAKLNNSLQETALAAWKGMVCEKCGRCNSRTKWDEWKCETEGCTFEIFVPHTIFPVSSFAPDHAFEAEGHAIPFDKWSEPVVRTESVFRGYWRKATYELLPGNYVTHYFANQEINRQPGGADDILLALQGAKMGLQRSPLAKCASKRLDSFSYFDGANNG